MTASFPQMFPPAGVLRSQLAGISVNGSWFPSEREVVPRHGANLAGTCSRAMWAAKERVNLAARLFASARSPPSALMRRWNPSFSALSTSWCESCRRPATH